MHPLPADVVLAGVARSPHGFSERPRLRLAFSDLCVRVCVCAMLQCCWRFLNKQVPSSAENGLSRGFSRWSGVRVDTAAPVFLALFVFVKRSADNRAASDTPCLLLRFIPAWLFLRLLRHERRRAGFAPARVQNTKTFYPIARLHTGGHLTDAALPRTSVQFFLSPSFTWPTNRTTRPHHSPATVPHFKKKQITNATHTHTHTHTQREDAVPRKLPARP